MMGNTVDDITKNRREKINLELSTIDSLYGREDVLQKLEEYKFAKENGKKSAVPSRKAALEEICKAVGLKKKTQMNCVKMRLKLIIFSVEKK